MADFDRYALMFLAGALVGVALLILIALTPDALRSVRHIAFRLRRR